MPLTFTKGKIGELHRKYDEAVKNGVTKFTYDGHELLVSYAKYLIQYLESYNK